MYDIITKKNSNINNLFKILIKNLPPRVSGWNSKSDFHLRKTEPTAKALSRSKWIEYNHSRVNFLIIDVDDQSFHEVFQKCIKLDIEPSFMCETDKGCQVFYTLENSVDYEWSKTIQWIRDIKEGLTHYLEADKKGSHRLKGIWRNPLQHHYFNSNYTFDLNDFDKILKKYNDHKKSLQQKFNSDKYQRQIHSNHFDFKKGNRNNYLWYSGMQYTYGKTFNKKSLTQHLRSINKNDLDDRELNIIINSVEKYNLQNKNHVKPFKDYGVMGFEKIKNLSKEDYEEEKKKRQKLAAKYTNDKIKNDKDLTMNRIENAKLQNDIKQGKNRLKIKAFITSLFSDGYKKANGKWHVSKLAEELDLSRPTVMKHLKEMGEL